MGSVGYARALRARWITIVSFALICMCLALLMPPAPRAYSQPSTALENVASPAYAKFRATAILGVPPPAAGGASGQFRTVAFYLQSTEVGSAFADRLDYTGDDLGMLGRLVTVGPDAEAGTLTLVGFGGTPEQAADITNAFILSLQDYLGGLRTDAAAGVRERAQAQVDELRTQIDDLSVQIEVLAGSVGDPASATRDAQIAVLRAEYDALIASYTEAYERLTQLTSQDSAPTGTLTVLRVATPENTSRVSPSLIYQLPVRIALGLVLGLALGIAVALLLEHNGRKVSSREAAERAFGARVIAEIPRQRVRGGLKDIAVVTARTSTVASTYRMLRAVLLAEEDVERLAGARPSTRSIQLRSRRHVPSTAVPVGGGVGGGTLQDEAGAEAAGSKSIWRAGRDVDTELRGLGRRANGGPRPQPVLVVAAVSDEIIQPVVVANVAASFAEDGRRVVVLRLSPSDTASGGAEDSQDDGERMTPPEYAAWARQTSVPGVRALDWCPGPNVPSASEVVSALRDEDVVVVVDPGKVATAEFAEVAPSADGVIAVCEYRRTRIDEAERAGEIIAWSRCTFRGVVLAQTPGGAQRWWAPRVRRSPLYRRASGRTS